MSDNTSFGLVRIFSADDKVQGAGVYVSVNKILTCAHVVSQVFGYQQDLQRKPDGIINIDFPLIDSHTKFQASVEFWGPLESVDKDDVAILTVVSGNMLNQAKIPQIFSGVEDFWDQDFRVFGFPKGHDGGVWASGVCRGTQADGYIQIEDTKQTGYAIQPGFSGTPVWNNHKAAVIGIVVAADMGVNIRAAYIIPFSKIKDYISIESIKTIGRLHGIPSLPIHYLQKEDDVTAVYQKLLSDNNTTAITSTHSTVMLQGMGGIGKSVLASALAIDMRVRSLFQEIIWLTIGQNPSLIQQLMVIGEILNDDLTQYSNFEVAKTRLETLLQNCSCLLILDDVWDAAFVSIFKDILGPKSKVLITTRDRSLATDLGGNEYKLDVLQNTDALKLLSGWAAISEYQKLPLSAKLVAEECGYLPFALALCGAMVRDGVSWDDLLNALREVDLSFIKRNIPNYPYPDILKALKVSVDTLSQDDFENYKKLAIFSEDTLIPEETIILLWMHNNNLNQRYARRLLSELNRKALINLDGIQPNRTVRLHDLQHDYLIAVLKEIGGLHKELLSAYSEKCPDGWYSGPDDGYYFFHLADHLIGAGKVEELKNTLFDLRYLARKTLICNIFMVDKDFDLAEKALPKNITLQIVRKVLQNCAHLLVRSKNLNDTASTLLARFSHLQLEELNFEALKKIIMLPHIGPWYSLPDNPDLALVRTIQVADVYRDEYDFLVSCDIDVNNQMILIGGPTEKITLLDLNSGAKVAEFGELNNFVTHCSFSPDGRSFVSTSKSGNVFIWDILTKATIARFNVASQVPTIAKFNNNGTALIVGLGNGQIKMFNINSGEVETLIVSHNASVTDLAISQSVDIFVSASADKNLYLWDIKTNKILKKFIGHKADVNGCAISEDGELVVSVSSDCSIRLWNTTTGEEILKLYGGEHPIHRCRISRDKKYLLSCSGAPFGGQIYENVGDHSAENLVKLWDLQNGKLIRVYQGHGRKVVDCQFVAEDKMAISISHDNQLRIWNVQDKNNLSENNGHKDWVMSCAVSQNGKFAATCSDDTTVRIWDGYTGKVLKTLIGHTGDVNGVAITKDESTIISSSFDTTIKTWDVLSGKEKRTFLGHKDALWYCSVSHSGREIVSASYDMTLKLWAVDSGKEIRTFVGHKDKVRDCIFSSDDKFVISTSHDRTIKIWDKDTGNEVRSLIGHVDDVCRCRINSDDSWLLTASDDNTLKVWDFDNGNLISTLYGHTDKVRGCGISADGKAIVSCGQDDTIRVWNIRGEILAVFFTDGPMFDCAWWNDSEHIIAVGARGVYFLKFHN